ncbi:MAG: site-specific integrase [Burkholderiales bacterium]
MTRAVREWHWLDDNPVRKVTKNRESLGRTRFLSREELSALLDACTNSAMPELSLIVRLAVSTGMRRGEILGLRWSDVHLDRSVITIAHTKNGDRRTVPIGSPVRALLVERHGDQIDLNAPVFPGNSASRPIEIRDAFDAALKRAGIKDFTFHDLRHTAASYLAMSGASLSDIAAVLGHKTLAMVKRYSHVSEQHTAGVLERMNAKFLG